MCSSDLLIGRRRACALPGLLMATDRDKTDKAVDKRSDKNTRAKGDGRSDTKSDGMGDKGSRGSDPRLLGLTMGRLLDRTFGERPRASRIIPSQG